MPTDKKPGTPTDRPCVVVVCWKHVGSQPATCVPLLFKSDKLRLLWSRLSILWFTWCYPWQGSSGMWYVLTSQSGSSQLLPFLLYSGVFRPQPNKSRFRPLWFMQFSPLLTVCPFLSLQAKTWASPAERYWCWTGEFWPVVTAAMHNSCHLCFSPS